MKIMSNRLSEAASPYLRAHAGNPVDWWPWCPEALELARTADKPILLSVGYAACHWCHVMMHESFEDAATAALMNAHFVNIKVDREERPDLDAIYQLAHQLLTRRAGGWPLTVFLEPVQQRPFFAGTYFPPQDRHGLPSFGHVLEHMVTAYGRHRQAIVRQAEKLAAVMDELGRNTSQDAVTPEARQLASRLVEGAAPTYDASHGALGGPPNFPQVPLLEGLWAASRLLGDDRGVVMVQGVARAMAHGGLMDHVGGGFFRYCVDGQWHIPHFEKMLYDNALLLGLYAELASADGPDDAPWAVVAQATCSFMVRELLTAEGFISSLDADSPRGEGGFYLWSQDELAALPPPLREVVAACLELIPTEAHETGDAGRGHLVMRQSLERAGAVLGMSAVEVGARLEVARAELGRLRAMRSAPARDEKILSGLNALAVQALVRFGRACDDSSAVNQAATIMDQLAGLVTADGRLQAGHAGGRLLPWTFLEDQAFGLLACLELLAVERRPSWCELATALAEGLLNHFAAPGGGFYQTPDDHETLVARLQPWQDGAVPSGNGAAALALDGLGHLLGECRYLTAAAKTVQAGAAMLEQHPLACPTLVRAALAQANPASATFCAT
jgi:uncharacterized protein YyaL (SSP411 family)